MGALPKGKTSHSKKNMRRIHDKLSLGQLVLCSHCRRPHMAHHICESCGYYNGREIIPDETTSRPA